MARMRIVVSVAALLALAACAVSPEAAPDPAAEVLAGTCAPCHGPRGVSRDPAIPSLAGRSAESIEIALAQYRSGVRGESAMRRLAAALEAEEVRRVALWFSRQDVDR